MRKKEEKLKLENMVCSAEELKDMSEEQYRQEGKKSVKTYFRKNKFKVWSTIIVILIMVAGVSFTIIDGNNKYQQEVVKGMLMYQRELYAEVVIQDVKTFLSIHNEETYQAAKKSLNFSDELKAKIFREEHYGEDITGTTQEIEILNIEYDLSNSLEEKKFIITVKNQIDKKLEQKAIMYSYGFVLFNGISNFLNKIYVTEYQNPLYVVFNYAVIIIIGLFIYCLFTKNWNYIDIRKINAKKFFILQALLDVSSSIFNRFALLDGNVSIISVITTSSIVVTILSSRFILKEKITYKKYLMILGIFICVLILSLIK